MATIKHKNFAQTTLGAAVETTDGTSITVTSEASFPAVDFIISIDTEAMLVTNVSTTTWTVTRGYEGSTAATHLNGAAIYHDISAAEADAIAAKLPLAGGTMTGNLIMDNMDVTLVKLLTLHGEIDDGNSSTADTIDWNTGAAHKSTLTGDVTLAFTGYGSDTIPTMSSNTAPSGIVSASSSVDANKEWWAFDKNSGTWWRPSGGLPQWLQYQFPTAKTIISYGVMTAEDWHPTGWDFQGSNNGTDWTTLDTRSSQSLTNGALSYYSIASPASFLYYRINVTAGDANCRVAEVFMTESGILNPAAPCFLTLKLVQDGTGGRVVTWPATVKGSPSINLAANATSNVLFYWDGTNYWTLNGKQFVSATDKVLGRSTAGAGEIEEIACTAAGRALLDDANAAAQLTTLGAMPLAGGTMSGDITLGENTAIALDPEGSADEKWSGITVAGIAGATLAVGDLCYLNSSFKWVLADADAASTSGSVALGLCVLAAAGDTSATRMLLVGTMRSAAFPASITGGAQLYVSATAGDMTTTIPTGADVVVRVCGWAILTEPNTIYFCPSADFITHV